MTTTVTWLSRISRKQAKYKGSNNANLFLELWQDLTTASSLSFSGWSKHLQPITV